MKTFKTSHCTKEATCRETCSGTTWPALSRAETGRSFGDVLSTRLGGDVQYSLDQFDDEELSGVYLPVGR